MMAEPKLSNTPPSSRSIVDGKDQKIAIAGVAERRAIAIGMLVNNVVADADMNRHRNVGTPCGRMPRSGRDMEMNYLRCAARRLPQPEPLTRRL